MGLFSRIAQNFKHGGVKLQLQAPASVSMSDAAVPVSVTVMASDSPHKVNSVKIEVIADPIAPPQGTTTATRRVIATTQSTQSFDIPAGGSQTVQLSLAMNVGAAAAEQLADIPAMAAVANAIGQVGQVAAALDTAQHTYIIQAVADVDGISFDPSAQQPIQVLKPGTTGTGFTASV